MGFLGDFYGMLGDLFGDFRGFFMGYYGLCCLSLKSLYNWISENFCGCVVDFYGILGYFWIDWDF